MDDFPGPVLALLGASPARVVFEHGGRSVQAGELLGMAERIAGGLRAAGAGPGTDVGIRLGVHPPAFAAILATYAVGARMVGAFPGAGLVVDEERLRSLLVAPAASLGPAGRPGDVARIIPTSGSTGDPKGCCYTYAGMGAAWTPHPDRWPPAVGALAERLDRFLVFGSLTSQVMWEYAILTLAAGGTLVTADPPGLPAAAVRHRATASVITVGKLNQLVRAAPTGLPLRALLVSGSPLHPGRLSEALATLGPIVFHGYGQTETGMISMLTPDEMLAEPSTRDSVGRPPVAVDTCVWEGELFVRTPAQAVGYRDDPRETADIFSDGWVRTRDLATIGDDGCLRLLGRTRDVIIVHATLVHAVQVERVLCAHPAVADACVTGAPDDDTGEAVHAYVVTRDGCAPPVAELRAAVAAELGPLAAPRTVTQVGEIPLTATGKPDKRSLIQLTSAC